MLQQKHRKNFHEKSAFFRNLCITRSQKSLFLNYQGCQIHYKNSATGQLSSKNKITIDDVLLYVYVHKSMNEGSSLYMTKINKQQKQFGIKNKETDKNKKKLVDKPKARSSNQCIVLEGIDWCLKLCLFPIDMDKTRRKTKSRLPLT